MTKDKKILVNLDEAFVFRMKIDDLAGHCKPKKNTNLCFTDIKLEKVERRHLTCSSLTLGISKRLWDKKKLKEVFNPRQTVKVIIIPEDMGLDQYYQEKKVNAREAKLAENLDIIDDAMEKRPNGCKYLWWFFDFLEHHQKLLLKAREEEQERERENAELLANVKDVSPESAKTLEDMLDADIDPFDDFEGELDDETMNAVDAQIEKLAEKAEQELEGEGNSIQEGLENANLTDPIKIDVDVEALGDEFKEEVEKITLKPTPKKAKAKKAKKQAKSKRKRGK